MRNKPDSRTWIDRLAWVLTWLYVADRLLKVAAVIAFFRRPAPPPPADGSWPAVTLIQPVTRGASNLPAALDARAALEYPGSLQHVLVCDGDDGASQAVCHAWLARHAGLNATIATATPVRGPVASKIEKMEIGLAQADGAVIAFIDDDVIPRPEALRIFVAHLGEPGTGAVFGLACYTEWSNIWSSLVSAFVNANALLSYIPLTYLAEPFTITGHFFAFERTVLEAAGGLSGLAGRLDDDHELARRVRRLGRRCVQTPVIYDIENRLDSLPGYANQMRRWFVIPRQTMAPFLTGREQAIALVGSAGNLVLPLLALLAFITRRPQAWRALAGSLALFGAVYLFCERVYLRRRTPLQRWPLVFAAALVTPLQALAALATGDEFVWRGQRIRLQRGGQFEVIE